MDYLYKITIGIDDDKVLSMRQHDLNAVYKTVRNTFARCNFKEQESENGNLVFTIGKGKDSFSEVGIATGVLRETLMGSFLVCGNCGSFFFATVKTAYCPYCGAKMNIRGVQCEL